MTIYVLPSRARDYLTLCNICYCNWADMHRNPLDMLRKDVQKKL